MIMRYIFFFSFSLLLFSCNRYEPQTNAYFAEFYPQVLADIAIECVESTEEYFISAVINGQEFCHDQEKVGDFRLAVVNKFTTSSPTVSTGEVADDARHGIRLSLGESAMFNEHFNVSFPDFNLERSGIDHLDSLLALQDHDILGSEDILVPAGATLVEKAFLESSGGYLNRFLVTLNSRSDTIGNSFSISSIFGDQENSYLRFNEFRKTFEPDGVYYYLDIDFECNLYHWPQYGYEGLWGEIREGKIIVKLKLKGA